MEMERESRNGSVSASRLTQELLDGVACRTREVNEFVASSPTSPSANGAASVSPSGVGSIEHRVSMMDTLAGIAIKYGVEVADIKRMNGLMTDLQMFAHEKLQIPLPGRHPPSPVLPNGSSGDGEQSIPNHQRRSDVVRSYKSWKLKSSRQATSQQTASPVISILQGYYGLTKPQKAVAAAAEGTELAIYGRGQSPNHENKLKTLQVSEPPSQNSGNVVDGFPPGDMLTGDMLIADSTDTGESDAPSSEKSCRRRQKADADLIGNGDVSGKAGKSLGPKLKSVSKMDLDSIRANANSLIIGDSFMADGFMSVRKASSTPNLEELDSSFLWSTKWTLKSDSISKPIFDGLPKPSTSRRNKAALD